MRNFCKCSNQIKILGKKNNFLIKSCNVCGNGFVSDKIDKNLVDKELEIIKAEIKNSGKPDEMAEKISKGKISKFLNDNSLLDQVWIMDPKKKVSDILRENSLDNQLKVLSFVRYKVGEGV